MDDALRTLDREAIATARGHMGSFALPTVVVAGVIFAAFGLNLWLFAAGVTPLWLATLLFAALTYFAYTPLHEAVHGNIRGNNDHLSWVEEFIGYASAQLVFLPFSTHRMEHMVHHRYTNDPERDPDFLASSLGNGFGSFMLMTLRFYWNGFSFIYSPMCKNATTRDKALFWVEASIALVWRVAFLTQVPLLEGLVLLVVGYIAAVYYLVYWFAYRPHHPYETAERYRNTSSFIVPNWLRPLRWTWMNQDLHSIHHLYPRVPFYRYRVLFNEIEPILRAHGNPIIGIFDRQPVPAEAKPLPGSL